MTNNGAAGSSSHQPNYASTPAAVGIPIKHLYAYLPTGQPEYGLDRSGSVLHSPSRPATASMVADELGLLALLAQAAPAVEFEELVRRARQTQADPLAIEHLETAKLQALRTRALLDRQAQREVQLAGLVDATRDLVKLGDLDDLLYTTVRWARLLLNADIAGVCLLDRATGGSLMRAVDGAITSMFADLGTPSGVGATHVVTQTRAPFWSADYLDDDRVNHDPDIDSAVSMEGICAVLSVPLLGNTEVIGVLHVAERHPRTFTPDEITLMSALAEHAAAGVGHALTREQVQTAGRVRGDQRHPRPRAGNVAAAGLRAYPDDRPRPLRRRPPDTGQRGR